MLLKRKVIIRSSLVFERSVRSPGSNKCSGCRYFEFTNNDCRFVEVYDKHKLIDVCYSYDFILIWVRHLLKNYVYIIR